MNKAKNDLERSIEQILGEGGESKNKFEEEL